MTSGEHGGGVVEDVIDTDLSTCGAGEMIRFPFRTCDEGFGASGTRSSWACGPTTPVAGYGDAPVGDGPQFDVDDTGLLFATAPSGLYYPLETSALVSPPMDLSGCAGRSTSLSFWHWYHFAPGAGGLVEVWDGKTWNEARPIRGYGGPIEAARPTLGRAPAGFVTPDDRGSGWRFEVFDVSPYVNPQFRVRFRFFAGLQRRPGWYVDTVAVSTFALEDLPRLDGDPKLPGCGFGAAEYVSPRYDLPVPDPCIEGQALVPGRTVYVDGGAQHDPVGGTTLVPRGHGFIPDHGIRGPAAATGALGNSEVIEFRAPSDGAICILISNGGSGRAGRVASGAVSLDDREIISANRFGSSSALLRQREAVGAGRHKLVIQASAGPGGIDSGAGPSGDSPSSYGYQVYFQPGAAMPVELPAGAREDAGGVTGSAPGARFGLSNLMTGRQARSRGAMFELDATVPGVGTGPQAHAAPYVIQIADARTCRQVREIGDYAPIPVVSAGGMEEAFTTTAFTWDGRDDQGRPVRTDRVFVRLFATDGMAGLDLFPSPGPSEPSVPREGPWPPFDHVTGPPSIAHLNTAPIMLIWGPSFFQAHVLRVSTAGEACGNEGGALGITCAPGANWLADTPAAGDPLFSINRYALLTGRFPALPAGETYQVVFRQGTKEWVSPAVMRMADGLTLYAGLPMIGTGRPAGTENPSVGTFTIQVRRTDRPDPLPRDPVYARFRAPYLTRLGDPGPDEFLPEDNMPIYGHLLATYRARFAVKQGTATNSVYPPTAREALLGWWLPTADDAIVEPVILPRTLVPGYAQARATEVADGNPIWPSPAITFEVPAPEVTQLDGASWASDPAINFGRACFRSAGCRGHGEGGACVVGTRLEVPAWGPPGVYFGVDGSEYWAAGESIWRHTDTRICFNVPAELHNRHLGDWASVVVRYPSAAAPIRAGCPGGECYFPGGPGTCSEATAPDCYLRFRTTGRKDGPFHFYMANDLTTTSASCATTLPDGTPATVSLSIRGACGVESGGCSYEVNGPAGRIMTGGPVMVREGVGGFGFGGGDCRGFAVLTWFPTAGAYVLSGHYLGNNLTENVDSVPHGIIEPSDPVHWERVFVGFSPDDSVMVTGILNQSSPDTLMEVYLANMCGSLDAGGSCDTRIDEPPVPWLLTSPDAGSAPYGALQQNRVSSLGFGGQILLGPGHDVVSVRQPDPNEP